VIETKTSNTRLQSAAPADFEKGFRPAGFERNSSNECIWSLL